MTQSCTTSGSPTPSTSMWATLNTFCHADPTSAGGCSAGNTCVAKPTGQACLIADGGASCPPAFAAQTFYTGISDSRTCSCSCTAAGGSCSSVSVDISSSCDGSQASPLDSGLHCGVRTAAAPNLNYKFSGMPTAPSTCSATAILQGGVVPNGQKTVCCQ